MGYQKWKDKDGVRQENAKQKAEDTKEANKDDGLREELGRKQDMGGWEVGIVRGKKRD